MTITFYNTSSPFNAMTKKLQYISGYNNLPLKKDMDVLTPIFEMTFNVAYPLTINYMYIEDFKRYYFTRVEVLTGERVKVLGEVDPLMSWQKEILSHNAWVERQKLYDPYVPDNQLVARELPIVYTRKINGIEFTNTNYVLITNGRG